MKNGVRVINQEILGELYFIYCWKRKILNAKRDTAVTSWHHIHADSMDYLPEHLIVTAINTIAPPRLKTEQITVFSHRTISIGYREQYRFHLKSTNLLTSVLTVSN